MSRLESSIQKELLAICKGYYKVRWMSRANSGKVKVKGGFMQLHPKGTPDIIGFSIEGQFIGIELKRPETKTKLKEEQEEFQSMMKESNCIHGVAWDKDSLLQILDNIV